ncbi:hypothetical protein TcYC6_0059890 [Trypanosoma cruzi]|nr:hypothetical protein TcYC6_0059890 [Trypanosoma cruzi]
MKTKAVAASGVRVPAPKGAPESSHASESSDEPANGSVAMDEARQDATSSLPQRQDSTAQPLGNKKGPAVSRQTFSSDVIGLTTPAAKGEMEEEAASSGGMAPALSPTPSAGSRQEVLEAKKPFSGERPEGGQEPLPSNLAASTMGQAGKADEGSLRNGNEDDWMQHRISLYVLRSVHNEPANADTLTSEEQDADREEDMRVRTAVGTNSGPDLLNSTQVTPADATTSTTAPNRDQTIVHHKDNVSDDVGAAPTPTSTAAGGQRPHWSPTQRRLWATTFLIWRISPS